MINIQELKEMPWDERTDYLRTFTKSKLFLLIKEIYKYNDKAREDGELLHYGRSNKHA